MQTNYSALYGRPMRQRSGEGAARGADVLAREGPACQACLDVVEAWLTIQGFNLRSNDIAYES